MKKLLLIFMLSCATVTLFAQQLTYRMANPRIIRSGGFDHLEFDVQVRANAPGTLIWGLQQNFTFNNTVFSTTAAHWTVTRHADLSALNTAGNPKYAVTRTITGAAPNLVFNVAIAGDVNVFPNDPPSEDDYIEMPTTFRTIYTLRARLVSPVANQNLLAGISFIQTSMNGQQQFATGASTKGDYTNPNIFDPQNFMNSHTGRFFSTAWGWSQIDNTVNAQWVNWANNTATTIWDGSATITQTDATPALINNLHINTGATLTVAANKYVTVSGNMRNDGNIILNNTATGTASLLTSSTITGSGTSTVNQFIDGAGAPGAPSGRMWYITSPVASATSNVFNAASASNKLWSYNEPTYAYTEIHDNTSPLTVGSAFVARMGAAGNVSFTGGKLNTGSFSRSLSRTGTAHDKRGYHLLGNPYPSYVNPTATMQNLANNLTPTIWYRTSTGTAMKFETFNYQSLEGTGGLTVHIPPLQGFWVQVKGDGNTGTFALDSTMRTHQTNNVIKTSNGNNVVKLFFDNGANTDEAIVLFNSAAGAGFDNWDSEKMMNNNPAISELYTIESGKNIVINSMPELINNMIVPLFMNVETSGQHTISADLSDFNQLDNVYLQDLMTSATHDLRTGPYTFTSTTATANNRFNLLFTTLTSTNDKLPSKITVYSNNHILYINVPSEGLIEVFDLLGKQIANKESVPGINEVQLFAKGVYVVRVVSKEETFTTKVTVW